MRLWASMNFMNWSVRGQLLILAILLTLPSVAIIIYAGLHERREAFRMAVIESQKLADNIFAEQQNLLASAHQLGKVIAELPDVQNGHAAKMQPTLANLVKINPQFQSIVIIDINGKQVASALPSRRTLSFADRRFFKNAVATRRFSSGEYVIGKHTGKPTIPVGYPLINKEGKLYGVVGLAFNLSKLEELLQRSQLPLHANYIITDLKGTVLTRGHDPAGFVGKELRQERFEQMRRGPDKDTILFTRIDGDDRIGTYRKLWIEGEKDPYMYVLAGLSAESAMVHANRDLTHNITIVLAFVLVTFAVVVLLGRHLIADRIEKLQLALRRIAEGDFRTSVADSVKGGELGELALAVDHTARMLDTHISQLRMTQEELSSKQRQLEELNESLEARIQIALNDLRQKDQMLILQGRFATMGEMLSNIAHQWRQPLNNIGLMIQNLQFISADEEFETSITKIMQVIKHMSGTIDDFRNFFRPEKEKCPFVLNKAVTMAVEFLSAYLSNSGIRVEVHSDEEVIASGYQNEYAHVLLNIVNNAKDVLLECNIPDPRIYIRVFRDKESAVVTVRDNGGGIDAAILPKIFDPYFTTKRSQGTGIGLYMSKVIIEKNMGGKLGVANVGDGAEFRIEI